MGDQGGFKCQQVPSKYDQLRAQAQCFTRNSTHAETSNRTDVDCRDDIPNTIGNIPRFPTVFIQVTFLTFQPHPTSTSAYELPGAHRVYQVNPVAVPLPSSTRSQRLCSTTAGATPLGSVQARLWMPSASSFQRNSYIPFRFSNGQFVD